MIVKILLSFFSALIDVIIPTINPIEGSVNFNPCINKVLYIFHMLSTIGRTLRMNNDTHIEASTLIRRKTPIKSKLRFI